MTMAPPTKVITEQLRANPRLLYFGTYVPPFWTDEFGSARIRFFPIAEHTMVGAAVGAAIAGLHPIVHLNRAAFAFVAMDQIVNQAAKLRYMSGEQFSIGITLRAMTRGGDNLGAQHEQSPYGMFAHVPGIKVVVPSTIEEAAGLYLTAFDDPNPVFVFEAPQLYEWWDRSDGVIEPIPFGAARVWRRGADVTIVAIGVMVREVLTAADRLAQQNISCAVIDPRTLVPLDMETIAASVRTTGRLVVVDEAPPTASMAAEIIAAICDRPELYGALAAMPVRVCGAALPMPFSPALQADAIPNADRIVQVVERLVSGSSSQPVAENDASCG
ncbi:MAG TPA: transketolase C-terminal domain-containing protein [Herpetosiphonaceae bacterium]